MAHADAAPGIRLAGVGRKAFSRYHYDACIPVEKVPSCSIMMPQEVINQGERYSHIRGRNEVSGREAIRGCCWP
jgi:hypothetical protein